MLLDLLKEKRCFKLVCAAGNEDETEVEKLVTLYSLAGCNFFDLSASPNIIDAAKKGLEKAGITEERYLCCSVGIKGDPHISKAYINEKCKKCGKCSKICPQNAIMENPSAYKVCRKKCIGCGKCIDICPQNAISTITEEKNLKEILPPIIEKGIDCIELHTQSSDEYEIEEKWNDINKLYDGVLSICTDRYKAGNEVLIKRVSKMLTKRAPYTTIIQADGAPMSGDADDYKTTLQTVATAEIFQNANLPAYIILSGGTNSKSTELAKLCNVDINGIAIGTFARKIVKQFTQREDFFYNKEVFEKALSIAKNLVNVSLENLR